MMVMVDRLRPSFVKVPFAFFNLESEVSLREKIIWFIRPGGP